jgi:hypothetical protein
MSESESKSKNVGLDDGHDDNSHHSEAGNDTVDSAAIVAEDVITDSSDVNESKKVSRTSTHDSCFRDTHTHTHTRTQTYAL